MREAPWSDPEADRDTPVLTIQLMPNGTARLNAVKPIPFPAVCDWLEWMARRFDSDQMTRIE